MYRVFILHTWFSVWQDSLHDTDRFNYKFDDWSRVLHGFYNCDIPCIQSVQRGNCWLECRNGFSQVVLAIIPNCKENRDFRCKVVECVEEQNEIGYKVYQAALKQSVPRNLIYKIHTYCKKIKLLTSYRGTVWVFDPLVLSNFWQCKDLPSP